VGLWSIFYDFGTCGDGQDVGTTWIEFYSNGTFYDGQDNTGTWTQSGNRIDWYYPIGTHYTGIISGSSMNGTMVSFSGWTGCWSANKLSASDTLPQGSTDNGRGCDGTELEQ
jgi:hypothetical protein